MFLLLLGEHDAGRWWEVLENLIIRDATDLNSL